MIGLVNIDLILYMTNIGFVSLRTVLSFVERRYRIRRYYAQQSNHSVMHVFKRALSMTENAPQTRLPAEMYF